MKEIIESDFDAGLYDIAVVDFWADWCQPCHMMMPTYNKIAAEISDVHFFKANIEENNKLTKTHNITAIPAILIFKNGQIVNRLAGIQTETKLRAAIMQAKQ